MDYEKATQLLNELDERLELELITLKVLAEDLERIAEEMKDLERRVKEL